MIPHDTGLVFPRRSYLHAVRRALLQRCPPPAFRSLLSPAGLPKECRKHPLNGGDTARSGRRDDGTCIFCNGNKCSIHGIKPETCRAGPFTFDVKGDIIEIFLKYETICPVVGLLREDPEAYEHQFALAKKSITHLVRTCRDEELEAICRIEEPETEKVAEIPREYHDHRH